MNILVTGGAGFIGSHLVDRLLQSKKNNIVVVDNFDPFYDRKIKEKNVAEHLRSSRYKLIELDIAQPDTLDTLKDYDFDCIVHLAAKAGVRPSIEAPLDYQRVNVSGTMNLLEYARQKGIKQFVSASSSSVYGVNPNTPWRESDHVLKPISPYAATKVATELLGATYSHLHGIRFIGLRFFTVYGPRQRPDLAIHKFVKRIQKGETIDKYGDGSTSRDYTFVEDIVDGIIGAMTYQVSNYEIFNLGNKDSVTLNQLIEIIENKLGKKAKINQMPEQMGDVPVTYADIDKAREKLEYSPKVSIEEGISRFIDWINAEPEVLS